MTQDEMIEMAKLVGIEQAFDLRHHQYLIRFKDGSLEAFAKLVAAKEREACAQVCEDIEKLSEGIDDAPAYRYYEAIRARV